MEEKSGVFATSATYFVIAAGISLISSNCYVEDSSKYVLYVASGMMALGGLGSLCSGFGKKGKEKLEEI